MFNLGGQTAFAAGHRQNADLLGFKFGVWEGGHRVPFIARWPGRVPAGTTSKQVLGNVDMLATFAALTDQELTDVAKADSVNMLPALTESPASPIRDHLVLAPHKGSHLSIRRGKWMYIPRQGSGGFAGKKPGDHTFGGPPAVSFVGSTNSDIDAGKIKPDAPEAQLYDLESDTSQTLNLYEHNPEVVEEMQELLQRYTPKIVPKRKRKQPAGNPAPKSLATPSEHSVAFDFESGMLTPWKIVQGDFGHVIGNRTDFFHGQGEYNKQGEFYLTTLEPAADATKGRDAQTGIIVSPLFTPDGGDLTFRVGGGSGSDTYVALCSADGVELLRARGINSQVMQKASWDLTHFAGQELFIKIADLATGGWGHITVDNFQLDAKVSNRYPNEFAYKVGLEPRK